MSSCFLRGGEGCLRRWDGECTRSTWAGKLQCCDGDGKRGGCVMLRVVFGGVDSFAEVWVGCYVQSGPGSNERTEG